MKSDILLRLIKEVVKNEVNAQVKEQVKEQLGKLIKSGVVTLNSQKKQSTSLMELTEVNTANPTKRQSVVPTQQRPTQQREFTKDPVLNEILNQTTPFTSAQRTEGAAPSILDSLQPEVSTDGDWETMNFRGADLHNGQIPNNAETDAITKALTRDYTELVKRF
jgi:hypothetical protein